MDLSNVVFIEDKPKSQKDKAKGIKKGNGKKGNGKKVKKVPLKGRAVKHNKPQKSTTRTNRAALENKKKFLKDEPAKGKPKDKLPTNRNKVPPKNGAPKTKRHGGKTYHWCPHCNFWSFHKPGKGKRCQAVDPLNHLLNYFGGNAISQPHQRQPENVPMVWDDISL